jgi:hypothetical protein
VRELDALGRIAEEYRRGAFEDDEHLLLYVLEVAGAAYARWQAPDVGAHVLKGIRERSDTAARIAALRRLELELVEAKDRVAHVGSLPEPAGERKLLGRIADSRALDGSARVKRGGLLFPRAVRTNGTPASPLCGYLRESS